MPAKLVVELIGRDVGLADALVRELAAESLQIIEDFKNHRLLNTTARIGDHRAPGLQSGSQVAVDQCVNG